MAINTTTVETNLTTKLNATTGTTDAKEFLLLGKAVEAFTPTVTVNSVITEGNTQVTNVQNEGATQVAAVQAASSGFAALTGATFTGAVTIPDLTVTGTTTSINTTTLDVADKNITIAQGAADAAAADGAGLTVDGASATFNYANTGDKWTMNKALDVTGALTATSGIFGGPLNIEEVKEKVITDATTSGTYNFDAVNGAVVYMYSNQAANRTINFRGDGSTTLNSIMADNEAMTFSVITEQGSSAYYFNSVTVDGSAPTYIKWSGGAPTGGNASSIDIYTFTILKLGSASFKMYASQSAYS
ncbi:MAG: hypothetical protein CL942_06015 [Desulfovibrio sp.]|nr:hypothetical protein [Desulfovibrio sp.]|tara:strand:- start:662 stop:1567 length:906 start_codon:yes stop_codon:yes gene_type:complete